MKYWHVGMNIDPPKEGTYTDVEYYGASFDWVDLRTFPLWSTTHNILFRYKEI